MPRHLTLKSSAIALALGLLHVQAYAVDYLWKGGSQCLLWDDAACWTLLGVPGSGDSATILGTGTGTVLVRDPRSVGTLFITGNLATTSTLTVDTLAFGSGYFGRGIAEGAGGVMNVTGATMFAGTDVQNVHYSHIINLGGSTTWTQGNGRISVDPGYSAGNQSFAASALNIGAGTTFTDLGAASDSGYKVLSGTNINGNYLRTGLGATYARNVNVAGTLTIADGDFIFDTGNYANTSSGTISVAAGSTLGLSNITFTSGSVVNNGLVRQVGGTVTVGSGVQIGGNWVMDRNSPTSTVLAHAIAGLQHRP